MSEVDDNQPVLSEEEIEALVDHAATDNVFDDGHFKPPKTSVNLVGTSLV